MSDHTVMGDAQPSGGHINGPAANRSDATRASGSSTKASAAAPPRQSCTACRARKIKCNKALPQCAQCQRAGTNCFYAASQRRGRPRNGTTPAQPLSKEAQLEKRVKQLEAIIASLRGSNSTAGSAVTDESVDPLEAQLGKLVVGKPYLNDSFWMSEELKDILGDSAESSGESEDEDEIDMGNSPQSSNQDFILGQVPAVEDLSILHPPIDQISTYWRIYLDNCEPFLRLIHVPTTDAMVRDAIQTNLQSLTPSDELHMFCFYFTATTSLPEDDCLRLLHYDKDVLLSKFQIGIKHALARAKFMHSPDFKVLQGLVIYLTAVKHTDDAHGAINWTMTGLAIRIAQSIGLDRDGTLFNLPPLQTELRRRVWWQLILNDLRASEARGTMSTLLRFDTQIPTHINDTDIDENTTEMPKPRKGPCDMTISCVRLDIAKLGRRMQGSGADDAPLPPPVKMKMVDDFADTLVERYYHPNENSPPIFRYSYKTACLITARMKLMMKMRKKDLSQEERDSLFQIAIEIMEHFEDLRHDAQAKKWSWLLKTTVQWHAVAFALAEMCVREPSPQVERAWSVVEKQKEEWVAPADSSSIPIYQSVKKLLAKAEKHRRATSHRGSQGSSPMSYSQPTPTHTSSSEDPLTAGMIRNLQPQMGPNIYNWANMVDPNSVPNVQQYSNFQPQWQGMPQQDFAPTTVTTPMFYPGAPMMPQAMAFNQMPDPVWPWDHMLAGSDAAVSGIQMTTPNAYLPVPNNPPQWSPAQTLTPEQIARLAATRVQAQNWNG